MWRGRGAVPPSERVCFVASGRCVSLFGFGSSVRDGELVVLAPGTVCGV